MQRKNTMLLRVAECCCLAVLFLGGILLWRRTPASDVARPAAPLIVFALDSSCSMLASSGDGTRLSQAQALIRRIASLCPVSEVSLVSFGGDAMVDFPPSADRAGFLDALNAIEPTLSFSPGSDPGSALRLAQQLTQKRLAIVVMVTDGELQIADEAALAIWPERTASLVWSIVGKGPAMPIPLGGSWLRDPDTGEVALSQADDSALRQLAGLSECHALQLESSPDDAAIASALSQLQFQDNARGADVRTALPLWGFWLCIGGTVLLLGHLFAQTRWMVCAVLALCISANAAEPSPVAMSAQLSNRAADVYATLQNTDNRLEKKKLADDGIMLCVEALRHNPENSAAQTNLQLFLKMRESLGKKEIDPPKSTAETHGEGEQTEKGKKSPKDTSEKRPTDGSAHEMDDALGMAGEAGPSRTVPDELQKLQKTAGTAVRRRDAVGSWRSIVVRERPMKGRKAGLKPW